MKFPQMCLSDGYRYIPRNQNRNGCVKGQHPHIFPALQELLINSPDSVYTCKNMKLPRLKQAPAHEEGDEDPLLFT